MDVREDGKQWPIDCHHTSERCVPFHPLDTEHRIITLVVCTQCGNPMTWVTKINQRQPIPIPPLTFKVLWPGDFASFCFEG